MLFRMHWLLKIGVAEMTRRRRQSFFECQKRLGPTSVETVRLCPQTSPRSPLSHARYLTAAFECLADAIA